MKRLSILSAIVLLVFSCKTLNEETVDKKTVTPKNEIGINLAYMDTNVRPQDDFYNYVNGQWMKTAVIPADRARWGSFDELRKKTDVKTLEILDEAIVNATYPIGTDQRKALDYYATIVDTTRSNKLGIQPILPILDEIKSLKNIEGIAHFMSKHEPFMSSVFMGIYVRPDMKDSNKNVLYVYPAGLGLPEREYYVGEDDDSKKTRIQYREHIANMIHFLKDESINVTDFQDNIMALETRLAKSKLTKEERRKPENRYNPMTIEEMENVLTEFPFSDYLKSLGVEVATLINTQPAYFKELNVIFKENDMAQLKDFLIWSVLNNTADMLGTTISDTNWEFYGKILDGQQERKPLQERALQSVNWEIGEAVGKIYVDKMFPPEAKSKAKEMVNYLQKAYKKRINALTWMSDETKQKAVEKVMSLQIKIGYPDKWKDYSELVIKSIDEGGSYFTNNLNINKWNFKKSIEKLKKPVDKTEWGMAPQIVNAYYNPMYNEIVFPAAILQPPFYDYKADEAVNYGGMGAVIGHEISHGFDDQGAKFNAEGNFENWWTEQDFIAFNKLGKKLANQFSSIEVLPNIFVNGEFTLGENIGDLGGTNSALTALELYYQDHTKPGKIQGFTPEQRFFMSWATIWRTKSREAALKKQIKTDPHAPGQVRAVQPLKNIDAFYQAFDIKDTDAMYMEPEERVYIW